MAVNENIRKLRLAADLTQDQLAEKVGVARSTITQWESGWSQPRMGKVEKLAKTFNVPLSAIVDGTPKSYVPEGAIRMVSSGIATLPLVGRVHAGEPTDPEIVEREVDVPASIKNAHPDAYCLEVEGDCMDKVYPEGCIIAIDPNVTPRNGSIAAVKIDGNKAVMRRMYRGVSTLVLSPESTNPEHTDIVITADDEKVVELIGTVVWFQSNGEME